jgi:hypothetical protein
MRELRFVPCYRLGQRVITPTGSLIVQHTASRHTEKPNRVGGRTAVYLRYRLHMRTLDDPALYAIVYNHIAGQTALYPRC